MRSSELGLSTLFKTSISPMVVCTVRVRTSYNTLGTGPPKCVSCIRGRTGGGVNRRECVCRCATRVRTVPVCVECRVQTGARFSLPMTRKRTLYVSSFTLITVYTLARLLYYTVIKIFQIIITIHCLEKINNI